MLLRNPKKIIQKFKNSFSKKSGEIWIKFIFNEIENDKGRNYLQNFIEKEIPDKIKKLEISQNILNSKRNDSIIIEYPKKNKDQSLLYYYEQKEIGNDLSLQFQKTHISFVSEHKISYIISQFYRKFLGN
ncbi:hypothetical protein M0811_05937 [Anaeramoeba ignava]|uniref:Uncharacterized protein n=1 Tax=Anaeramoeba ignava TaxID=1746090 RepID=A0A9Q0RG60_ANAIG|nr:hypothetical protein M0811_05937 [Anaeramoeba ignava]